MAPRSPSPSSSPSWRQAPATSWPTLPHDQWEATRGALHLWTQIAGKIRLVSSPWINHSWAVPLYVSSRGLSTSLVPYGSGGFDIDFDLIEHRVAISTTDGERRSLGLEPMSTGDFYGQMSNAMSSLGMPVEIDPMPNEIADAVPFPEDTERRAYDPDHANALWRALVNAHRVFTEFRAGFVGKVSPVHFFWGSFDLAVTRFSGREAPPHPGGIPNLADDVAREAYSHEVTSLGFWPGNAEAPTPVFYAYAYPTPEGYSEAVVAPEEAFWYKDLGEFVLPYDVVRTASDPDGALLAFAESTHAVGADLAGWDRTVLEAQPPMGPNWWHTRPHD